MADVFQIIATDKDHEWYDESLVESGEWHAGYSIDDPRTVCGIQLMGEDGIAPGPIKKGKVTCPVCIAVMTQIKAIKNWK